MEDGVIKALRGRDGTHAGLGGLGGTAHVPPPCTLLWPRPHASALPLPAFPCCPRCPALPLVPAPYCPPPPPRRHSRRVLHLHCKRALALHGRVPAEVAQAEGPQPRGRQRQAQAGPGGGGGGGRVGRVSVPVPRRHRQAAHGQQRGGRHTAQHSGLACAVCVCGGGWQAWRGGAGVEEGREGGRRRPTEAGRQGGHAHAVQGSLLRHVAPHAACPPGPIPPSQPNTPHAPRPRPRTPKHATQHLHPAPAPVHARHPPAMLGPVSSARRPASQRTSLRTASRGSIQYGHSPGSRRSTRRPGQQPAAGLPGGASVCARGMSGLCACVGANRQTRRCAGCNNHSTTLPPKRVVSLKAGRLQTRS